MSTFVQLQQLTTSGRFSPNDLTDVKAWLNSRAQRIWTGDPANGGVSRWQFQITPITNLAVLTPGTNTVKVPDNFRVVDKVYDDRGDELVRLTRDEFYSRYQPGLITATRGRPNHYCVVNRTIYFSPIPDSAYQFTALGLYVWGHDDGAGNFVAGDMVADADMPYWPSNHHYVLVAGAKSTGTKLRNDPTYPAMDQEYRELLASMVEELAEDHGVASYGMRDPL